MRYFLCTLIGLALMVAAFVGIAYAVSQMLQVGTCASGGPYQVARECPAGMERLGLAIPVAILAIFIGAGVYSIRGTAPGSDRPPRPGMAMVLVWCGIFFGIAFACFWGVWGPDANPGPGGKLGGLIVGFLFVPLGIGGAVMFWFLGPTTSGGIKAAGVGAGDMWKLARSAGSGSFGDLMGTPGAGTTMAQPTAAGGNVVSELERLSRLRREGTISEAEFERLKKRALDSI